MSNWLFLEGLNKIGGGDVKALLVIDVQNAIVEFKDFQRELNSNAVLIVLTP